MATSNPRLPSARPDGARPAPEERKPAARLARCRDCGRFYNVRDLAEVLHHIRPGHEPDLPAA